MSLAELVVNLGVKADTFTVRDFGKAISDLPLAVASAITSMGGLSLGFIDLTKNVLDMTTGLMVFTSETGLNTRALQQWQQAAKEVGLSPEVATNSIARISQLIAAMRTGHGDMGAMQALAQLGVRDISGTANDVMNRIQAAAGRHPAAVSADLLARAGIYPEMMRVFSISQSERERIPSTISTGQQAQLAEFTKELAFFNQTALREFTKVLVDFEPYMKDLTAVMAATLAKAGGIAGYSIGETSRLIHAMIQQGGFTNFMDNLANSMETPENLHNAKYVKNEFSSTINVHGVADPHAVAAAIDDHHKKKMTNAIKAFNNQGVP